MLLIKFCFNTTLLMLTYIKIKITQNMQQHVFNKANIDKYLRTSF